MRAAGLAYYKKIIIIIVIDGVRLVYTISVTFYRYFIWAWTAYSRIFTNKKENKPKKKKNNEKFMDERRIKKKCPPVTCDPQHAGCLSLNQNVTFKTNWLTSGNARQHY
jgi:hypothetical protein